MIKFEQILPSLKKTAKLTIYVRQGELMPSVPHGQEVESFSLGAEKINSRDKYRYYLYPGNMRLVVNRKVVRSERIRISENDEIQVYDTLFNLKKCIRLPDSSPIITLQELEITYPDAAEPTIKKLNFSIRRGEFVALMGPSGCGKTTLLKELAGANRKSSGEVYIAGRKIADYFHLELKTKIGYVQQYDNLHPMLTVEQTLYYTARLRRTPGYRHRADELLAIMNITGLKDRRISALSGGQRKRVAIVVELLDQPDILLLDEPTSPLDPESVDAFLTTMNRLAKTYHRAIIMVTHKPDDMKYVDKVLFLGAGGYRIYGDDAKGFIPYVMEKMKEEGYTPIHKDNLLGIYSYYSKEQNIKRYRPGKLEPQNPKAITSHKQSYNFLIQLYWLICRYIRIKFPSMQYTKDKDESQSPDFKQGWVKSVKGYISQPLLVGMLFWAFPNFTITSLFLISLAIIWFGVNNASKEIVEELPVYQRERAYNLKIDTYLLSKISVLAAIAVFQISLLLLVVWLRFQVFNTGQFPSINLRAPFRTGLFLFMLSLASSVLGLCVSTFSDKVEVVLMWVPIILIPQIILSGLVSRPDTSYKEGISYAMIGRWGLEGLCRIQDSASEHWSQKISGKVTVPRSNAVIVEGINPLPYDSLRYDSSSALYALGAYNNHTRKDNTAAWTIFNSLQGNYLALLMNLLLFYILCRLALMKSDAIPMHWLLQKKFINRYMYGIGALFLILYIFATVNRSKEPVEWNFPVYTPPAIKPPHRPANTAPARNPGASQARPAVRPPAKPQSPAKTRAIVLPRKS